MQVAVEVKPGLIVRMTIDQQPGTRALDVRAMADMTRGFCLREFGMDGGDRTFEGRLPEGINLVEVRLYTSLDVPPKRTHTTCSDMCCRMLLQYPDQL